VQDDTPSSLYFVQSDLSFPTAMPYVGLGWGHHQGASDLQQESHDFQDEVHKFEAIPQLTIGLGYRF
jgi:hypothetical protein